MTRRLVHAGRAFSAGAALTIALAACRGGDRSAARGAGAPDSTARVLSARGALVFVSNEDSASVSVIDAQRDSVIATIAVGKRPRGLRVSPDGKTLYVAVSGSPKGGPGVDESKLPPPDRAADGIAVVDIASRRVLRRLPGGPDPETFALSPDGAFIYVSNEDAGTLSIIDVARASIVARIPVGSEPEGVATSPDGRTVYVTSEGKGQVAVIDVATRKVVATLDVGKRPRAAAFTPNGTRAYVTAEVGRTVSVIDVGANKVIKTLTIQPDIARPMGIVVAPDGKSVYVSNGRGGTVAVIDVAADSVVATIPVHGVADANKPGSARPWGIGITPDGRTLYTANGPTNDVSAIDVATRRVLRRVPVGRGPWGIAIGR